VDRIPAATKIIWRALVDLEKVYKALDKLKVSECELIDYCVLYCFNLFTLLMYFYHFKEINPLYKDVNYKKHETPNGNTVEIVNEVAAATSGDSAVEASDVSPPTVDVAEDLFENHVHMEGEPTGKLLSENEVRSLLSVRDVENIDMTEYSVMNIDPDIATNVDDLQLYETLKVIADPLAMKDKKLDMLCFPELYPYGKGGMFDENRRQIVRPPAFIKQRFLHAIDNRFRLNKQYLFDVVGG
jgi:hypothetical protein